MIAVAEIEFVDLEHYTLAFANRLLNSMFRSQVSLDYRRVVDDLLRASLGQLFPGVQHHDPVGDAHDRFHVMLDNHLGDAHAS